MLGKINKDMEESIRLLDSLYIELLNDGLNNEGSKNKLISLYEKLLRINITVIKDSADYNDMACMIINYYCELCHATSSLFEYYRKLSNNQVLNDNDLKVSINNKIDILNNKVNTLKNKIYQRELIIEELENELDKRDELLINKYIKENFREKFKNIRNTWVIDKNNVKEQLKEKDNIIEKLMNIINNNKVKIKELETLNKSHNSKNPAKRIDVKDNDLVELYLGGESPYKIGKRFNMSQSAVIYRLKQMNIYITGGRDTRGKNNKINK
jgi:flagellar biosynthesis chaperone FliJ